MKISRFFLVVLLFHFSTCIALCFPLQYLLKGVHSEASLGIKDEPTKFRKPLKALKADSEVSAFMGDSLVKIILEADTVQAFFINGWHRDSSETHFEHYKVKAKVANLTPTQKDSLKRVLFAKESYIFSEWAKKAEFIPALGFTFIKGKERVSCLMAYDCDLIQFKYHGKWTKKENCDPSHGYFKNIGSRLFTVFKENADNNPINLPEHIKIFE